MILISKVLLWQRAGYVSKDVWNDMDKIVNPELLPSQQEINEKAELVLAFGEETEEDHMTDEKEKLCGSDAISEGLFLFPTRSLYPSKRKDFALKVLGLEESEYDQIHTELLDAMDKNYQVVFKNYLYFKDI